MQNFKREDFVTRVEAAEMLGVSYMTIRRMWMRNEFPEYKIPGEQSHLILRADVEGLKIRALFHSDGN